MKKVIFPILSKYWLLILLTLFIANVGLLTVIRLRTKAATCFTTATIAADSRCLYILSGKVYNKGSRSSPHHGHPCGQDVTSIIPSFHITGMTSYLDPNYVGDICTSPSPTPIPSPTIQPTYRTCMNLACTTVVGIGTNQCNSDADCIPAATPTPGPSNCYNMDFGGTLKQIDISDVQLVAARWNTAYAPYNFNHSTDGLVDIADVQNIASKWGVTCP